MNMTKQQAIEIFGSSGAELGRALGLSRGRISQWPEVLDQEQMDRVIGAAMRLGKAIPDQFRSTSEQVAA